MPAITVIVGAIIMAVAIVAGLVGTWHNLREAEGPRERRFVLWTSIACWLLVASMLAFIYLVKPPYRYFVVLGYLIVCPILVFKWSTTHQLLRRLDQIEKHGEEHDTDGRKDG